MEGVSEARRLLREAGRDMSLRGLAWGNAGNLSARLDAERFLVTASGARLGELGEDDFAVCRVDGTPEPAPGAVPGATPEGAARRPSKEVPMHRAVYGTRPEVRAVLHASPFYATLVACSSLPVPHDLFVEAMYYLERVARVPYRHPGSAALGEAVRERAPGADALLLENHGVLVLDTSVQEALQGLQVLELACRMLVTARGAGLELEPLPPDTVEDFLERSGYRPRRKRPT